MEKPRKGRRNCRPLAAERPAAATFVFLVPCTKDLLSEGCLHGASIFLALGSSHISGRKILSLERS